MATLMASGSHEAELDLAARKSGARALTESIQSALYRGLPRTSRLEHTRRAFRLLPPLDKPHILDVGCGSGVPTLELMRLCRGQVVGLDTDLEALEALCVNARAPETAHRVHVVRGTMRHMAFADASFDVVWAEGSAHIVGVENALVDWRRLLRPDGCLVLHEIVWLRPDPPAAIANHWSGVLPDFLTATEYTEVIPDHGYRLLGHFCLPESAWWDDCYSPLAERIDRWRAKRADDPAVGRALDAAQRDVDFFREHSNWCGSAFFVMQRCD